MERFMYFKRLWKRVLGMHVIGQFFLTAVLLASVGALVVACGNDELCGEDQEKVDGECKSKSTKKDSQNNPATAKAEPGPSAPAPAADDLLKRAVDVVTLTLDGSKLYTKMAGHQLKSYDHLKVKFRGGWELENGKVQTEVTHEAGSSPRSNKYDVTACKAKVAEYEVSGIKVSIGEDKKSLILTFPNGSFETQDLKQIEETVDAKAEYGASEIQEEFTSGSTDVSTKKSKACFRFIYASQDDDYEIAENRLQAETAPTGDPLKAWNTIKNNKVSPAKDKVGDKVRDEVRVPRLHFYTGDDDPKEIFKLNASEVKYLLQVVAGKDLADKVNADAAEGKKGFKTKIEKYLVGDLVKKANNKKGEFSRLD